VCLEESIYVHNIRDMKVTHTIRDTPANPLGLMELTGDDVSILAYPGAADCGHVHLFDVNQLNSIAMIAAHASPLAAIAFDARGTMIATASNKGTVIRVFQIPTGNRLFEFRRGMKR
jgi:autophagy-related protein 18